MKVVFEEDNDYIRRGGLANSNEIPGSPLVSFLLKHFPFLFKTKKAAEAVLLLILLVCIVISVVTLKNTFAPEPPKPVPANVTKIK
jgi:hypothetical protein